MYTYYYICTKKKFQNQIPNIQNTQKKLQKKIRLQQKMKRKCDIMKYERIISSEPYIDMKNKIEKDHKILSPYFTSE